MFQKKYKATCVRTNSRIPHMNMEQIKTAGGETEKGREQAHIRARNMMQIALTKRHCVGWEKKEMEKWLSQVLSPQFHELVRKRPELLVLYERDPEAALAEAERELHLESQTSGQREEKSLPR